MSQSKIRLASVNFKALQRTLQLHSNLVTLYSLAAVQSQLLGSLIVFDEVDLQNLGVFSLRARPQRCVHHLLLNMHRVINKFKCSQHVKPSNGAEHRRHIYFGQTNRHSHRIQTDP